MRQVQDFRLPSYRIYVNINVDVLGRIMCPHLPTIDAHVQIPRTVNMLPFIEKRDQKCLSYSVTFFSALLFIYD